MPKILEINYIFCPYMRQAPPFAVLTAIEQSGGFVFE